MKWRVNGPSRMGYVPDNPLPVALIQREGKGWYVYARYPSGKWSSKENWPTWKLADAKRWAETLYDNLQGHHGRTP